MTARFLHRGMVLPALDVVVPLVGYGALHAMGVPDVWALTAAGSATAFVSVLHSIRRRRVDVLGALVVAELASAVGLAAVTHDARLVLVRTALYLGVAGLVNVVAAGVGRPLTYAAAIPMATKGDPVRLAAYRRAWDSSWRMRAIHRDLSLAIGTAFLVYAAFRVVVVYTLSIGEAVWVQEVPGIVLVVGLLALVRSKVPALTRIVDAEEARGPRPEAATATMGTA